VWASFTESTAAALAPHAVYRPLDRSIEIDDRKLERQRAVGVPFERVRFDRRALGLGCGARGCGRNVGQAATTSDSAADVTKAARQLYLGDFDGDGTADRLYYTADATDDLLSTSHGNFAMSFPTGAIPKIGDFDGDGVNDVLFFTPGSADQRIWYFGASTGTPRYEKVRYLATGDTPIIGNFDGKPGDEIFWYGPGSITDSVWFFDSLRKFRVATGRTSIDKWLLGPKR
jgi:hypothetical protein